MKKMDGTTGTRATTGPITDERRIALDLEGDGLARVQGDLDVRIGEWLLAIREAELHAFLGHGSLAEYVERKLGLQPHATNERLRVAESLIDLAKAREALRTGGLSWSAARELTRVAIPETEDEWLAAVQDKTVRDVEELVCGRRPGQRPTDPADPRARRQVVRLEMDPAQYAAWRNGIRRLQQEIDPSLTEEEAAAEMALRVSGSPPEDGRAPYQIAIARCEDCGRAWQEARGQTIELAPETAELARCDAQHVGPVDEPRSHVGRASQTIPPAVRRQVMRRAGGCCTVPGCKNGTFVHVHHMDPRSEGGQHDPDRMILLCAAHHARLHEGRLAIEGAHARDAAFFHADGTPYGARPDAALAGAMAQAFGGLRHLGFFETESKRALAEVRSHVGPGARVEEIVRAALAALTRGSPRASA